MTFCVENEHHYTYKFHYKKLALTLLKEILKSENCKYDCEVNMQIVNDKEIKQLNKEYREIDKETDVLSFPELAYETPSNFSMINGQEFLFQNPETSEIILGDIILNHDRVLLQANEFGHSIKREYAFLITHSIFHLLGYDHMEENEEREMFAKQHEILEKLKIKR